MASRGLPIVIPPGLVPRSMPHHIRKFSGMLHENALTHIERYVEMLVINFIPEKTYRLVWFPATLEGLASEWYWSHAPDTFVDWEALQFAFLRQFHNVPCCPIMPLEYQEYSRTKYYPTHLNFGYSVPQYMPPTPLPSYETNNSYTNTWCRNCNLHGHSESYCQFLRPHYQYMAPQFCSYQPYQPRKVEQDSYVSPRPLPPIFQDTMQAHHSSLVCHPTCSPTPMVVDYIVEQVSTDVSSQSYMGNHPLDPTLVPIDLNPPMQHVVASVEELELNVFSQEIILEEDDMDAQPMEDLCNDQTMETLHEPSLGHDLIDNAPFLKLCGEEGEYVRQSVEPGRVDTIETMGFVYPTLTLEDDPIDVIPRLHDCKGDGGITPWIQGHLKDHENTKVQPVIITTMCLEGEHTNVYPKFQTWFDKVEYNVMHESELKDNQLHKLEELVNMFVKSDESRFMIMQALCVDKAMSDPNGEIQDHVAWVSKDIKSVPPDLIHLMKYLIFMGCRVTHGSKMNKFQIASHYDLQLLHAYNIYKPLVRFTIQDRWPILMSTMNHVFTFETLIGAQWLGLQQDTMFLQHYGMVHR